MTVLLAVFVLTLGGCPTQDGTVTEIVYVRLPTANDYTYGQMFKSVGDDSAVTVTPKENVPAASNIQYTSVDGTTYPKTGTPPTTFGNYIVTFDVKAVEGWSEVLGMEATSRLIVNNWRIPDVSHYDIGNLTQAQPNIQDVTITPKTETASPGAMSNIRYVGIGGTNYPESTTVPQEIGKYDVLFDIAVVVATDMQEGWNPKTLSAGTLAVNGRHTAYPTDAQIDAIPRSSKYNIAYMLATQPVLYFGLSALEGVIDVSNPTFYVNLRKHLNDTSLSNVSLVPGATVDDFYEDLHITENLGRKLYERDNSVHITYYGEDVRSETAIRFMYSQNIPAENITIVLLSDGAYSRNSISRYGPNTTNPIARLETDRAIVRNAIASAKAGIALEFHTLVNMNLAFMLEMPNAYWWYNGASSLPTDVHPDLKTIAQHLLDSGRIVNKRLSDLFAVVQNSGKTEQAKTILKMSEVADTDVDNGKKTLVIMGTYTDTEMNPASDYAANRIGGAVLPELLDEVIKAYSGEYNIFYKGHPAYPTVPGSEKHTYLTDNGILEISDASIPAEMLMYLIDDLYIGGYPGTVFQNSKDNQTLFLFSEPEKLRGAWLTGGLNNPDYFLHGNTYFIYKDSGAIQRTPVQRSDITSN